ncbi:hypothetical protein [Francisella sp. LA112445]|uniref:hypothetical protein n=1 Tax=Francisella sp. LA112445 TaxID=1395624 RepID=UPI001788B922|nr:hypothetical protein [Francisella sp. LA112445]QIW09164.1 hypothetical protein FIP56_00105 [Francisella sp. LA112445]
MTKFLIVFITAFFTYIITSLKIKTDYKYIREQKWLDKELETIESLWTTLSETKTKVIRCKLHLEQLLFKLSAEEKKEYIQEVNKLFIRQQGNIYNLESNSCELIAYIDAYNSSAELYDALDKKLVFLRPSLQTLFAKIEQKITLIIASQQDIINCDLPALEEDISRLENAIDELKIDLTKVIHPRQPNTFKKQIYAVKRRLIEYLECNKS